MADQAAIVVKLLGRKVKLLDDKQFRKDISRINQKTAKAMMRSFEKTTRTWDEKVKFQQLTEVSAESAVLVYTTNRIYGFVSGGTSVRRALMSTDYDPKTKPGILASYPGRGEVVYISRDLNLPGIEARNFPELVEKKHAKRYRREVEGAIKRAVKRSNDT